MLLDLCPCRTPQYPLTTTPSVLPDHSLPDHSLLTTRASHHQSIPPPTPTIPVPRNPPTHPLNPKPSPHPASANLLARFSSSPHPPPPVPHPHHFSPASHSTPAPSPFHPHTHLHPASPPPPNFPRAHPPLPLHKNPPLNHPKTPLFPIIPNPAKEPRQTPSSKLSRSPSPLPTVRPRRARRGMVMTGFRGRQGKGGGSKWRWGRGVGVWDAGEIVGFGLDRMCAITKPHQKASMSQASKSESSLACHHRRHACIHRAKSKRELVIFVAQALNHLRKGGQAARSMISLTATVFPASPLT